MGKQKINRKICKRYSVRPVFSVMDIRRLKMSKLDRAAVIALKATPAKYQHLIDRIVAGAGAYVAIQLDELGGDHLFIKQSRLLCAAARCGVKITSTSRSPGQLYARLLNPPKKRPTPSTS